MKALNMVAPHAGAWIETNRMEDGTLVHGSRPTRARGLKLDISSILPLVIIVAPHAGAWIETWEPRTPISAECRAPRGRVD